MAFLPPAATTPDSASSGMDQDDSEERRKAVQRFMARAEISMVSAGAPYVIHDASAQRVLPAGGAQIERPRARWTLSTCGRDFPSVALT